MPQTGNRYQCRFVTSQGAGFQNGAHVLSRASRRGNGRVHRRAEVAGKNKTRLSENFVESNPEVSLQRTSNTNAALCIFSSPSPSPPYLVRRLKPGGGGATALLLYFLLACELRLILSLELLHLRLGWLAGWLEAWQDPRGELAFFPSSYLAQEIPTNPSLTLQGEKRVARACGALPTSPPVAAEPRKQCFLSLSPLTEERSLHASPGMRTQRKRGGKKKVERIAARWHGGVETSRRRVVFA